MPYAHTKKVLNYSLPFISSEALDYRKPLKSNENEDRHMKTSQNTYANNSVSFYLKMLRTHDPKYSQWYISSTFDRKIQVLLSFQYL